MIRTLLIALLGVAVCPPAILAQNRKLAAAHPKLDSALVSATLRTALLATSRAQTRLPVMRDGLVAVTIRHSAGPTYLRSLIAGLGGNVANADEYVTEAYVPLSALATLAAESAVDNVAPIIPMQSNVVSGGVAAHNALAWQDSAFTGSSIRIGIIDGGFGGYASLVGTELPAPAGVRCYYAVAAFNANLSQCGSSVHGTAVAETIVDVAPDALLYVANPVSPLDFRATVEWMADQGVRIINFSASYTWQGPGDGTSPFPDSALATVDLAVSRGILFVASAGNHAQSTWTGQYLDANQDQWLEFTPGSEANGVFLPVGQPVAIQARWDDSWIAAANDLDLGLYSASGALVAVSANYQSGLSGQSPFEFLNFTPSASGQYYIRLHHFSGQRPQWIQVQAFSQHQLQFRQERWSIGNPAESRNTGLLAVGAAPYYSTSTIEAFSSQGPTIDGRPKPDLVAADRGATVSYGPFAGTSQASAHVAGLAALVAQRFPANTPAQVAGYLKSGSAARGTVPNETWGFGFAYLALPCQSQLNLAAQHFFQFAATGSVSVGVEDDCAWTAVSDSPWVTITGGASGAGDGSVSYAVDVNGSFLRRTAVLTIAGRTVVITQGGRPAVPAPLDGNGDGKTDIWWQHRTNGSLSTWYMDSELMVEARSLTPGQVTDPNWRIVGLGDFDADGQPDLFWQHQTTRLMTVWLMTGAAFKGPGLLSHNTVSDPNWSVRAIADLNNDGHDDLIWQHRVQGLLAVWFMDGVTLAGSRLLSPSQVSDTNWQIVGAADFDSDGDADLLWQHHTTRLMTVWLMNGADFASAGLLRPNTVSDTNWKVGMVADYDSDGKPDLLWQHAVSGALAIWYLDGTVLRESRALSPGVIGDVNWRAVGPD